MLTAMIQRRCRQPASPASSARSAAPVERVTLRRASSTPHRASASPPPVAAPSTAAAVQGRRASGRGAASTPRRRPGAPPPRAAMPKAARRCRRRASRDVTTSRSTRASWITWSTWSASWYRPVADHRRPGDGRRRRTAVAQPGAAGPHHHRPAAQRHVDAHGAGPPDVPEDGAPGARPEQKSGKHSTSCSRAKTPSSIARWSRRSTIR